MERCGSKRETGKTDSEKSQVKLGLVLLIRYWLVPREVEGHPFEGSTSCNITRATSSAIRWWMIRDVTHSAMLVLVLVRDKITAG